MAKDKQVTESTVLTLERPPFGQFARQVLGLPSELLGDCLKYQCLAGGKLGEIFHSQGVMTREQIGQVLRHQAEWVARSMESDLKPFKFPYPAFFSLCMPAYNEADNIEDTLDAACSVLPEFVEKFEIVVVNDGSKDNTSEVVGRYSERDPRVRLVNHHLNRGYGAAVTSALQAAKGDLIAFTDSDGQFTLLDLPQLLTRLQDHDVVIGYRYDRADNMMRKFNAKAWNWLIRTILGVRVRDLDCAFKLFRRDVLDKLQLTATGAAINAEIMVQCGRLGVRMCEMPVTHWPRSHGAPTGAAWRVILKAFKELPRLWKYRSAAPSANGVSVNGNGTHPVPVNGQVNGQAIHTDVAQAS